MRETTNTFPVPVEQAVKSARYVVDEQGQKTDVVIALPLWEALLTWLEDMEDRADIKQNLAILREGPIASKALVWQSVEAEWDDEEIV